MNIRDLPADAISGSRDFLTPVVIRQSALLGATFYRAIRGCGDYRPNPDWDDEKGPAPCLRCGRPASEHGGRIDERR